MSTGHVDLNMLRVIVVKIGMEGLFGLSFGMFGCHLKFVIFLDVHSSAQN